jgi:hypothetical protein
MKKWDAQTPVMSSALLMKTYRQQLWDELKAHPEWSVTQVDKVKKLIGDLNKQISRRAYDPDKVLQLINECERQRRIYKRVAKKLKISKRSVKFILKQNRKTNGRKKTTAKARPAEVSQGNIFE